MQGQLLVEAGRMTEGLPLLDEAMIAVTAGELSPIVSGIVYCGVILGCQAAHELRRAQEWTAALSAWCEAQPDMVAFTGRCLVHRTEILALDGSWTTNYGVDAKPDGENYKFTLAADGTVEFTFDPDTKLLDIVTK